MDLNLTPSEQSFRDEFRAWLKANIPPDWDASGFDDSEHRFEYLQRVAEEDV